MSEMGTDEAFGKIDSALRTFWTAANKLPEDAAQDEVNEALMDPADQVLLVQKEILECGAATDAYWYPRLAENVQKVREFLSEKNVILMPQPQTTSTGKVTFRPLAFKRFDL